jgi:EAL domain-containing protein (putative c-di-GMP-specific phosphodiesterase class I)
MTMLQEMGCEMAQGYLVGKPSPAEVAESLLGADVTPARMPSLAGSQAASSRT